MTMTFSILFYIRRKQVDSNGMCSIYSRITVKGKRSEMSVSRKIKANDWDFNSGRAKNSRTVYRELNKYLEDIRARLYAIQGGFVTKGTSYSAHTIKNQFQGKGPTHKTILHIYQDHNHKISELVGREYSSGAYQRHLRTARHLGAFISKEYGNDDMCVKDIDLAFIRSFEHFLKIKLKSCSQNTITKYLTNLKKVVRICYANDWIAKDPFYKWKAKWKKVSREILNELEIETLMKIELPTRSLEQVRDIFVFCCFTGLSYIDVEKLTGNHIILSATGEKWIKINRSKTDIRSSIPMLPVAESILLRYKVDFQKSSEKLLPVISNQKVNIYLKEIAVIAGIKKKLTFHLSRHTFATTVTLANGVPIESVSKMLGHTSLKTTQIYAKVLDKKLMDDMSLIKEKYRNLI